MRQDELYHHGIKGMKWGVRRYQNTNGSLTNAGKKRRKLSDKNKQRIKIALKVGAIAAGTALAAYGTYKLNQKTIKALIESYSDVGNSFANFSFNNMNIAFSKLISAESAGVIGDKQSFDVNTYSANYHRNLSDLERKIADELHNKASSRDFSRNERIKSAAKIAFKGSNSFKRSKTKQVFDAAQAILNQDLHKNA